MILLYMNVMENASQKGNKPALIYDGDCEFCRLWIVRLNPITKDGVIYYPSQEVARKYPQISPENFSSSVYFIAPDGTFCSGAQAIFKVLSYAPNGKWFLKAYDHIPGFAPISEWGYKQVAKNRRFFSVLIRKL